jgi:hypothetical protein
VAHFLCNPTQVSLCRMVEPLPGHTERVPRVVIFFWFRLDRAGREN